MGAGKALGSLRLCAELPGPMLLTDALITDILYTVTYMGNLFPASGGIFCLFDLILYVPGNNFSVMSGRVFLG